MNPAAPRDPVVTKVLLYSAGALFVLNFCAFVSGLVDGNSKDHEVTTLPEHSPAWCGETRQIFEEKISDALLRHRSVPPLATRIEIRQRRVEVAPDVAALKVSIPELVVSY